MPEVFQFAFVFGETGHPEVEEEPLKAAIGCPVSHEQDFADLQQTERECRLLNISESFEQALELCRSTVFLESGT